jgi:DNA-binding MarR family transcriptional regulator
VSLSRSPVLATPAPTTSPTVEKETAISIKVLRHLRRIIRVIDLDSHRLEHRHGVTTPQLVVLSALQEFGDQSLGELAQRVQLSASTVVGIMDRLVERGYASRRRDEIDRRRIHLTITDAGITLLAQAPQPLQEAFATRFTLLEKSEQLRLLQSLEDLTELLGARSLDAAPVLATGALATEPIASSVSSTSLSPHSEPST